MKRTIALFIILTSFSAMASDLLDGDVAKLDYNEASIYSVSGVENEITSEEVEGVRYYQVRLKFHVIGEGNTCGGNRLSLGVQHVSQDDRILIRLLTSTKKTSEITMCAEYAKETKLIIPEVMDLGTSEPTSQVYDFGRSAVTVIWKDRKLSTVIKNPEE
jgi:hypothetical protein